MYANKKILVIDDETDVTDLVAYHLRMKGWQVETLNDTAYILSISRSFIPDLMIIDVTMPGLDGLQICRLFRADPSFRLVPIILLTARAEEEDRIRGLETGADDYVCKPFSPRELVLRAERLLAKNEVERPPENGFSPDMISLDEKRHEVRVNRKLVKLTLTEFRLLRVLMERRNRVQTREQLLLGAWNHEDRMETRTVDTHIRRLREKLGSAMHSIETVRGVGYRFTGGH